MTTPHLFTAEEPRTSPQYLSALMKSAIQADFPTPTCSNQQGTHYRRPQCTHTIMNRIHGEYACHQCGKVPTLGWVYLCQQDHLSVNQSNGTSTEVLPLVSDQGNYFEAQAEVAKSLGMSASIIRQMRAGEYCYEQIETLLAQRRRVKEVIQQAGITSSATGLGIAPAVQQVGPSILPMTAAGTPYNSSANSPKKSSKKTPCNFQVCHACRPFIQDRLPMSVATAIYNEIPPVTDAEMVKLRVLDSNIIRDIGLRELPEENVLEESSPSTTMSSWSVGIGDLAAGEDAVPGAQAECDYDGSSPARSQVHEPRDSVTSTPSGTLSTGSSIGLPDALTAPLTPITPSDPRFGFSLLGKDRFSKAGKAATICGNVADSKKPGGAYHPFGIFDRDSNSSLGSEIEVEGGVALTEEAVETGMPDIVTDND